MRIRLTPVRQGYSAVLAICLASCAGPRLAEENKPWCSREYRNPAGATTIPAAQIFLVPREKVPEAMKRLRRKTLVLLSRAEAVSYVGDVDRGGSFYLVRGGVVAGRRVPLDVYYDTAKRGASYFALVHPHDYHLEVVTNQMGSLPIVPHNLPLIVQTELRVNSPSAVCYFLPEARRTR